MKVFNKVSLAVLSASALLGLVGPAVAHAATAPTLGAADGYSAYGHTGLTNTGLGLLTHLWGNVGDNGVSHAGLLAGQVDGIIDAGAGVEGAASSAFDAMAVWGADGVKNLSTNPQTVTPGVYTLDATQTLTGDITLSGAGVYIFRSDSAYHVANNARVLLTNGATACNVFWRVPSTMTIGTDAQMVGTIITGTEAITLNTGATLQGRALSLLAAVTLLSNQITQPTCATASSGSNPQTGLITVVKTVINDNGGAKTVADFPLFVNGQAVVSGVTNTYPAPAGVYTVTETSNANYTQTFSGACDSTGRLTLSPGDQKICVITNDDIGAVAVVPPLIDVVKVPSPLALPNGPGPVKYTYTLKNIGTVPVTNITMVGDTCSPITLISGDTNNDQKLDVNETWVYTCSTTLSATHTNIVTTTGWANGISAVDIASATVVVGTSVVPPLIHVTKIPSPLSLLAGGGTVIYLEKVTNPGTVALSTVTLTDDKCSPVKYISGDTNNDKKLDTTETWLYTCQSNLTKSTTNTATASGSANGLTATDFAVATVLVAAPGLPNTGFPGGGSVSVDTILLALILIVVVTSLVTTLRRRGM